MRVPNQAYILGFLMTCWILIGGYQLYSFPETQHVPLVNRTGGTIPSKSTEIDFVPLDLRALFSTTTSSVNSSGKGLKNIFLPLSFSQTQKHVVVKKPSTHAASVKIPEIPAPVAPEDLAGARARATMAEYRFLGLVYEGVNAKVFLVKNQEIFIVEEGDLLKNDIRLVKVQPTSILLQYAETDITLLIPISKSQTVS